MTILSLPFLDTLKGEELNLYKNLQAAYEVFDKDGDPSLLTRQLCREVLKYKFEDGANLMDTDLFTLFFYFATQQDFEMYPSEYSVKDEIDNVREFAADIELSNGLGRVIATLDFDDNESTLFIVIALPQNKSATLRVCRNDVGHKITYIETI